MDKKILDRYNSREGAESYTRKFRRHWNEYLNNWSEQRLVRGFLRHLPGGRVDGPVLDVPCGYGRIYPLLREVANEVVECDWSLPLLEFARQFQREDGALGPAAGYVRANALHLPFPDERFDLVLSARLSHHIRDAAERRRHVSEILRVSHRWVIFTYFDHGSVKNRLRELHRKFSSKRPKWTLSRREVAELAAGAGFRVVTSAPLSRLFSGHRYTLLERVSPRARSANGG